MRDHVSEAVLGLGSNMGDKVANIDKAVAMLCSTGDIRLKARSRYHRTAPWGVTDQDWFVNACIQVITRLSSAGASRAVSGGREPAWPRAEAALGTPDD